MNNSNQLSFLCGCEFGAPMLALGCVVLVDVSVCSGVVVRPVLVGVGGGGNVGGEGVCPSGATRSCSMRKCVQCAVCTTSHTSRRSRSMQRVQFSTSPNSYTHETWK